MFTGIISNLGKLKKKEGALFIFETETALIKKLEHGTSIAINGACMTVTDLPNDTSFSVEIMPESQKRTMLGNLQRNDLVNLELPAVPDTFLSGHIVQGHIDSTGKVQSIKDEGISKILTITCPEDIQKYVVKKGSISVNGISLTVINVNKKTFSVGIIPFTWEHTMLHTLEIDDEVNIETDILAKYAEKMLRKEG